MARVGGKRPRLTGPQKGGPPLSKLAQALLSAGLAKTPAEAQRMAQKLLGTLQKAGFAGQTPAEALKSFQQQNGLKPTGTLDAKTQQALTERGLMPGPGGAGAGPAGDKAGGGVAPKGGRGPAPDPTGPRPSPGARPGEASHMERPGTQQKFGRFVQQPSARPANATAQSPAASAAPTPLGHRGVEVSQAQARNELSQHNPEAQQMQSLLSQLQGRGFGQGQPTSARGMREALRAFQAQQQLPASGKMDAATQHALQREGLLTKDGQPAESKAPPVLTDARSPDPEPARAAADEGRGPAGGERAAADGGGATAHDADAVPQVIHGLGEMDVGYEDETGNAPSGDEDEDDERRGHATLDDGEEHEEGYYEVPALAVQIHAALEAIVRDDDLTGAPTYAWDVTFYKPGVYGRRQPATPLWHIGIEQTGPFDPIWEQAQRVLEDKLAEIEPEHEAINIYAFRNALRRARVRGQGDVPDLLPRGKLKG